ncbi:MAG TPA: hypothetical protein VHE35_05680 [Kofleriaceae bacterium]|nr:hypothetical protein [Kofleriaceae bacterium]
MTRWLRAAAVIALAVPAIALADGAGGTGSPAPRSTEPPPPLPVLTVPPTWPEQPSIADAARAAAAPDAAGRPLAVDAWGDPNTGCFVVAIALGLQSADAATVLAQLRTALAAAAGVDGWHEDAGAAGAHLSRPGWQGELRAQVSVRTTPRASAVACFYNDRAPTRCQAACAGLLAPLPDGTLTTPGNP